MNIEGKTRAVLTWAKGWPELAGYLKLNAIDANETGDAAMLPAYNDVAVTEYIDGTADREYTFELRIVLPWSAGTDDVNADASTLSESWLDWVSESYPTRVPEFGTHATITGIEPVQNVPTAAMVYPDNNTAEYSFSAKIYYTE